MTEDEMVGCYHQLDGQEIGQTPGDSEGQGGLACCSPGGCKESDTTERLNKNYHNSQSRNPSPTAHTPPPPSSEGVSRFPHPHFHEVLSPHKPGLC